MPAAPKRRAAPPPPLADCHAIVLAGGSGTRLWPLSRTLFPKQLLSLDGEKSLLRQTLERMLTVFDPARVWIVTNEEHVFEVRGQARATHPDLEGQVLAEPLSRNTLPAILLGLDRVVEASSGGSALAAVFPSDHLIRDLEGWKKALVRGAALARKGRLVTFGVAPSKPETGYGYIARGRDLGEGAFEVAGFIEKPELARAQEFLRQGGHFWNSGMFVFLVKGFLEAVAGLRPDVWKWWNTRTGPGLAAGYGSLPDVSVDYGVVERLSNQAVVEAGFDWDDLGSWEAVYRLGVKDPSGNVIQGDVLAMGCRDCLLISQGGKLAAVGLTGMIMVQTRDATLSCPLDRVQLVKDVVATLRSQGSPLVTSHLTVTRPWGSYTVLEEGQFYKIKRIVVLPGARLSLQMHHHRSEHWVVIKGTAQVDVGESQRILVENQSVDIPKATSHRLANPGKVPLELIEIQSGPYLEEDDIVRFDDAYGRIKP